MANPVIVDDVEARMPRPLTAQERTNAAVFLDDAWWMVTGRRPTLNADLTAGTIARGNVIRVLAAMVVRVLKNPDGKVIEAIDDYNYRRAELVSSGLLQVTDDELSDLTVGTKRGTRSVRLVAYGEY